MKSILLKYVIALALVLFAPAAFAQVIRGTYAIRNVQTGLQLRIKEAGKANGTPIVGYTPVEWKCMTWDFLHVEGQAYQLRNLFSQKTFQPTDLPAVDGTALEEQPLTDKALYQQYEFLPAGKDTYLVRLKGTVLYLTPADPEGGVNSVIILSPKKGSALQQWILYAQNPAF